MIKYILLDAPPLWKEMIYDYGWFILAAVIAIIGLIWYFKKKKNKKP